MLVAVEDFEDLKIKVLSLIREGGGSVYPDNATEASIGSDDKPYAVCPWGFPVAEQNKAARNPLFQQGAINEAKAPTTSLSLPSCHVSCPPSVIDSPSSTTCLTLLLFPPPFFLPTVDTKRKVTIHWLEFCVLQKKRLKSPSISLLFQVVPPASLAALLLASDRFICFGLDNSRRKTAVVL